MAGDWIKIRVSLWEDPKVIAMADALALHPNLPDWLVPHPEQDSARSGIASRYVTLRSVTVTGLLRVWCNANELCRNGELRYATLETLDHIAGDIPGFGEAMCSVGWAIRNEKADCIIFPNFEEYNTYGEDRAREQNRDRQRRFRKRKRQKAHKTSPQNVTLPSVTSSRDGNVTRNAREEKRREEEEPPYKPPKTPSSKHSKDPPFDQVTFPDGMDTPETRLALTDWYQWKAKSGKRLKDPGNQLTRILKRFSTPADFSAAVDFSIGQGYDGCFSPPAKKGASHERPTSGPGSARLR